MSDQWPGVSARGVLDGETDALVGLCDSRGPSVVGYCACVCGPERAVEAAAAAFAAFRAGAVRARDPLSIDPEALLLGRTRAAAAQRAPRPAASFVFADIPCSQIPALLAEKATGSISRADGDRLRQHLARCTSCQATQAVWERAERTYFHPTLDAVDPISREEIIDALRRAVPPPTRRLAAAAANGARPVAAPAPGPEEADGPAQQRTPKSLPRTAAMTGSKLTSTPLGQAAPSMRAAVPVEVILGTSGPPDLRPPASTRAPSPAGQPPAGQDPPVAGRSAEGWDSPTGVMSAVDLDAALGYAQAGVDPASHPGYAQAGVDPARDPGYAADGLSDADPSGLPDARPSRRRRLPSPLATAGAGRRSLPRVLGPVAVLGVGLLVALLIAGVFTGGSPHPSANPLSGTQTDPSTTAPAVGTDTSGSTAVGGSSTGGAGGGSATLGSSATSAGATTAGSRAAAKKRTAALARKLRAGGATGPAKTRASSGTTPSANGSSPTQTVPGNRVTSPTAGTPTPKTTRPPAATAPSTPATTRPATIHELGGGAGAPPITGVPATGATGYQPG